MFRKRTSVQLVPEIDLPLYRSLHDDLRHMDDAQLADHYRTYGWREGRRANAVQSRANFLGMVPSGARILEIGPFCVPLLRGPNVFYFDVKDREQLIERARALGWPYQDAPDIDYVSPSGDLRIVPDHFDVVLSSHAIEHQPNLIKHLVDVEHLLNPGGYYFVIIPDKNFCFDHFIPESTLAGVIEAHVENRKTHSLRSVVEHRALTTHNDPLQHWRGNHGEFMVSIGSRVEAAIAEYQAADGAYIDVHAWYFSPPSFRELVRALNETCYTGLYVERVYSTLYGMFEFWAILRKPL
jgi:SAM-dependent methyltransferase